MKRGAKIISEHRRVPLGRRCAIRTATLQAHDCLESAAAISSTIEASRLVSRERLSRSERDYAEAKQRIADYRTRYPA